jgi:hypothetical protein
MKTLATTLLNLMLVGPVLVFAADSPKDAVTAAAKKLGEQPNYSWKTTVVVPESAQFKPGPTEGRTEKDGYSHVTMSFGENMTEGVIKGDKTAVTDREGNWKLASELEGAEGQARFLGRMARNLKTPAAQIPDLLAATGDLKKDGDTYAGDLTEDGAKKQFRFGQPQNPKGSVKFWVKDGLLTKYEVKVSAKMDFGGNDVDATRTTTTEIQKVGETKVNIPTDAKKKFE